ncbi:MAG: uroporphyrinogen decarboxylase family protein [Spirochaetales bacterium]|nr:uroporphyrinogen decarboxylase family protein [Spirochaetales bacterium]
MTTKQRFIAALENRKPDRLPVTTHNVMDYYLNKYEDGAGKAEFFEKYGMDRIDWFWPYKPDQGQYWSDTSTTGYEGIVADDWRISSEELSDPDYRTIRYNIETPSGNLTMVIQHNEYTRWVSEHLLKNKNDLDIIARHAPRFICDIPEVEKHARDLGEQGICRSIVPAFDIYGQPGCWQDGAILYGIEPLIMETFDDPQWVKELLGFLRDRKIHYLNSMKGAPMELLELGGGDASTTVISPGIFQEFVAPFDSEVIAAAHKADQRIVYHTCGGMMPILEDIVAMGTDAVETLTPPGMGADVNLAEAFRRIGDKVCFIGGFDQGQYFLKSTPRETKAEVKRCFEACGLEGGYIISPSDHFFDAKPELVAAFAEAARECTY